ncbi:MAG: ABC transporter substrate-binding protein [Chloroflexota bacterium]
MHLSVRLISGLVLALAVAGCSTAPPPSPTAAPKSAAPAADTKPTSAPAAAKEPAKPAAAAPAAPKVNRLIMAVTAPDRETNDVRNHGMPDVWELRPMYEYLIGVDPETGMLIPQLATEWQVDPAGPSVRFKLRQGVQFHDGAGEFTAKDVVFSRDQLILPDSLHAQRGYYAEITKQIEVVNDYEVVFHLSRPDANFIRAQSENEGGFEIRSQASFEKNGAPTMQTRPIAGTGPYQYKERAQGQYIRFERVPYQHWRITPDFPEMEFRFVKESSTRLASLLANEAHITTLPEDLLGQTQARGMKVITAKLPGVRNVLHAYGGGLNEIKDPNSGIRESPLGDARVRKALDKAIDRDQLNKAFLGGKGESYAPFSFHPKLQGWDPAWETRFPEEYGYDPAAARALLEQAGYTPSNPLKTTFILSAAGGLQGYEGDMGESIGAFWRNIGVDVTLDTTEGSSVDSQSRARAYNNHYRLRNTSSSQYLSIWVFLTWGYAGSTQIMTPYDADIERLFGQLRNTLDSAQQDTLYKQIGETIYTRHTNSPLFWTSAQAVVNPNIVADYVWPGSISGTWTHVEQVKATR